MHYGGVYFMSFEDSNLKNTDEEILSKEIFDAKLNARKEIRLAEKNGAAKVDEATERAGVEMKNLMHASDNKAAETALELSSLTANRQAAMRARAERNLDKAASIIADRILND